MHLTLNQIAPLRYLHRMKNLQGRLTFNEEWLINLIRGFVPSNLPSHQVAPLLSWGLHRLPGKGGVGHNMTQVPTLSASHATTLAKETRNTPFKQLTATDTPSNVYRSFLKHRDKQFSTSTCKSIKSRTFHLYWNHPLPMPHLRPLNKQ